ncbi:MAG: sigma-54 interaction domain-containing protein [Bacillota bacterium]|jgi:PAS domain S-box-containing protein
MGKDKADERSLEFWAELTSNSPWEGLISILDAIQEGIIVADNDGWVHYVNSAFTNITGVKETGRVGKKIQEVCPGGPLSKVLKTGQAFYGEKYQMFDADKKVMCNAAPIVINDSMIGGVVIFQDVTELRRLSSQLEKSERTIKMLNSKLSNVAAARYGFENIVGDSPAFMLCVRMAKRAAQTDSTVLLTGESGTGKELFAHAIHKTSPRNSRPFVKVNCAAIPDNLLESEFFGFEKGAFTGANKPKEGMFDLANKGTIFLDEMGEMSLPLQAKLLRVLEEGEMFRVGGTEPVKVDIRVIAATNRNLKEQVKQGKFREDLFYRLNVINIELPPLRERSEDIVPLAECLLQKINRKMGKAIKGFSPGACRVLVLYQWPGNVRELRNCIERAVIMTEGEIITEHDLQFILPRESENIDFERLISLEAMEREMIKRALKQFGNTVEGKKQAASVLKISLRTLYNKISRYKL